MKELYLDNAASTKVSKNVSRVVARALEVDFANPGSKHALGVRSRALLDAARKDIASFIGAKPQEIVFTSGGTESNNLVIRGLAKAHPDKKHIVTSAIEHPSVLEVCKSLQKQGYKVTYLKPSPEGLIDPTDVAGAITNNTLLVSVMQVNSEIGTIQPIKEIGLICKKHGVFFHADAVQSLKKVPLDVKKMNLSLASFSAHKIGGPKGVGALYVKSGVKMMPVNVGGGQEQNVRSGTENLPGILGFAAALKEKLLVQDIEASRDLLVDYLNKIPGVRVNGLASPRVCGIVSISFFGVVGEALMLRLSDDGLFVSTGSACQSSKMGVSHVLEAIGCPQEFINGSIRISLSQKLSKTDVLFITEKVKKHVEQLRLLSPYKLNSINQKK